MKQTFTVGTCRYTVQVPDTDRRSNLTTDARMQARIAEVTELARKCKPRKPTVRADSRVYPRWGATASTADYVREYHLANANRYNSESVKEWVKGFYQPLSTRITPIEGEDACLSGL
jgi:hypothetical protein